MLVRLLRGTSQPHRHSAYTFTPWHFLNFFPDPHGHGSFRPTVDQSVPGGGVPFPSSDRNRPAPTIDGSFRAATGLGAGDSAGPMSSVASVPCVEVPSSGGMSSRMPRALYRFVGLSGRNGIGRGPGG